MKPKFTLFEYMYRDGGNFKTTGRLLLAGQDTHAEDAIRRCLDWGDQFVAEQIGVPALCALHWEAVGEGPSELDHAFHEFLELRNAEAECPDTKAWGPIGRMVQVMQVAAGRWDVSLSPNSNL